jgi:anaerobic ribonucleoside-triphosphate reductase activating protein
VNAPQAVGKPLAANLHALLPRSRANGPGWRFVVWFQGCDLNCPGCFNPETHSFAPKLTVPVADLADRCAADAQLEGVTLSGGEPLLQGAVVREFLRCVRAQTSLSVLLFSGFTREEILASEDGAAILARTDVLVAGRYDRTQPCALGLRTSSNQKVHLLTRRYREEDLQADQLAELIIDSRGDVVSTGLLGALSRPR